MRYFVALLLVGACFLARLLLEGVLGNTAQYNVFYLGVFLVAYLAGTGPAIVAALGSAVISSYWFFAKEGDFTIDLFSFTSNILFLGVCSATIVTVHAMRRAQATAEGSLGEASRRAEISEQGELAVQTLLDQAPVGIYVIDSQMKFWHITPAAQSVFKNVDNIIGRDYEEVTRILWPADESEMFLEKMRHTMKTGETYKSPGWSGQRIDLQERQYYDWQLHRIRLPEDEDGVVCYFTDISAHLQAQQVMSESTERFRFLAESMPQKIFAAKPNGDIDYFNQQWTEFTGLTFEQIRDWGWMQFVHPDDVDENVRIWKHALDTGEWFQFEQRFRTKEGNYRWHMSRAQPMRNAEGEIVMWIGSNTDVDDLKRAEQELREARDAALEASRAKSVFLAGMSHELRTPLNSIIGYAELLEEEAPRLDIETLRDDLNRIHQAGRHLLTIINDILDLSKIEAGKMDLVMEDFLIGDLVEQVVDMMGRLVAKNGNELVVNVEPDIGLIHTDETRLRQILFNLLSNAAKFTTKGTIWLNVEQGLGPGVECVVFRVTDTGIGIAPDEQALLFKDFMQIDSSTTRKYGGTGLGLALSKRICAMMDGELTVESELGKGSVFTARIPVGCVKPIT